MMVEAGTVLARPEGPMGPRIAASAASATSNTSNGSNASAVPEGLAVRRYKRIVAYRVPNFEAFVGLIAELLFKISRSSRGSVVRVNGRKLARYLGLSGTIHSIDLSVIYSLLVRLGFEIMRTSRGAIVVISMDKPVMKEVRATKDVNEAIEIVRKHLGE